MVVWGDPSKSTLIDGKRTECGFRSPNDLVLVENENSSIVEKVWVSDSWNNAIRLIDVVSETVTTIAGSLEPGHQDGPGKQAKFDKPVGIEINKARTKLFICDWSGHTVRTIDLTTPNYIVSTLIGIPPSKESFCVDGIGSKALISSPLSTTWFRDKIITIKTILLFLLFPNNNMKFC